MKQVTALNILKTGDNVFLTGSAGSGKTYTLNQYIHYLRARHVPVATTASTGIAATHMNGITIHSWAGIGIKDELCDGDLANLARKQVLKDRLQDTAVLIIDEVSMLHAKQFNLVNQVLKHLRHNNEPFGGIQVVVAGDFFQLPPIGSKSETNRDKFAFMSDAWLEADFRVCYLTEQHRQTQSKQTQSASSQPNDTLDGNSDNNLDNNLDNSPVMPLSLDAILNQIRAQQVTPEAIASLQNTFYHDICVSRTRLYTHNFNVDRINQSELNQLDATTHSYVALTFGDNKLVETLKRTVRTSDELTLKVGAKVMFIKNNNDLGVSNGTMGEIVGFKPLKTSKDTPKDDKDQADDDASGDKGITFANNDALTDTSTGEVAASEERKTAKIMDTKTSSTKGGSPDASVHASDAVATNLTDHATAYPVVRLNSGRTVITEPEEWLIEDEQGEVLASYTQVPLALAWAITIHKSQGMTLDAAEIDLSKTFELGQGYVALSRLKNLAGLKLLGMNDMSLKLDPLARGADLRFQALSDELETAYQMLDADSLSQTHNKFVLKSGGTLSQSAIEAYHKQQARKKKQENVGQKLANQVTDDSPSTLEQTRVLLEESLTVAEIAQTRGLAQSTIMSHISKLKTLYPNLSCQHIRPSDALIEQVKTAVDALVMEGDPNNFSPVDSPAKTVDLQKSLVHTTSPAMTFDHQTIKLRPIYETLGEAVSYNDIRLALIFV